MALTDWPLVILVVEVTEKKTENSQPSLRNRGNVCGIHTSLIVVCSLRLVLPQANIHDLADRCLRGTIHDLAE